VLEQILEPAVLEARRVLERTARAGLCHVVIGDAPEDRIESGERLTERRYWMTDLARQQVLTKVIRDPSRGLRELEDQLAIIGQRTLAADAAGVPILATVRRWATMAALTPNIQAIAKLLSTRCDELLTLEGQQDPDRSGTVLGMIQAAEPLEELLKGELTAALDRARRQLDLFHRRHDDDHRYLRHFLERPEQVRAFEDLLTANRSWALHFIGAAGAGKTMMMRYISSVLGPQLGASTARIDFDYLNPDYPAHKPGLLLAALAEELRLNAAGDTAAFLFAEFDKQVAKLHEQLTLADRSAGAAAAADVSSGKMIETFGQALSELPRPVILLIDTCEELAKLRPDGTTPEGVEKTFEMLAALQEKVTDLRVIFGGRRPLAGSGDAWTTPGGHQLPARPYLRLHEIRGFDREECLHYLRLEGVPPALREPILARTGERPKASRFIWTNQGQAPDSGTRYNPFEVSGWTALARQHDGEDLTPDDILSADTDRYIELRIIRRIRYPRLQFALPAVALLGRFDPFLLQAVLPGVDDLERVVDELRQQEWISRRGIDFYEVDEELCRRLLAHYERTDPENVDLAYQRAAEHLENRTLNESLSKLMPFHFDTAMRILQRDPARAARWWAAAEERFADEGQYEWARQLVEFMLGPEGACAEPDSSAFRPLRPSPLRAAVLATQLSCFTHVRPGMDRRLGWRTVEALLPTYPESVLAARLRLRAIAGKVSASLTPGVEPSPDEVTAFAAAADELEMPVTDGQVLASFIAALEAMVERAERENVVDPGLDWSETAASLYRLATKLDDPPGPRPLAGFAASIAGRIGKPEKRRDWFKRSIEQTKAVVSPVRQRWLDWLAPDDLLARVRLEFIRGTYPSILGANEVLRAITLPELPMPGTIDAERLASAVLTVRASIAPIGAADISLVSQAEVPEGLVPTRNVHWAFAPLTTVLAEALAALGAVDEALERLSIAGRAFEQSTNKLDSVAHVERAMLRIVRRMRLRDEGRGLTGPLTSSADPLAGSARLADRELIWSLDGLDGPKGAYPQAPRIDLQIPANEHDPAKWRHARWRTLCSQAWDMEMLSEFSRESHLVQLTPASSFAECSSYLDAIEANGLAEQMGARRPHPELMRQGEFTPERWWRRHPERPEEASRLYMRYAALAHDRPLRPDLPSDLNRRLGNRRLAEIALDEAEMLALRLPELAWQLFELSKTLFGVCHDDVGTLLACTGAALSMARAGNRHAASDLIADVSASGIQSLSFVPPWTNVSDLAHVLARHELDSLGPAGWRPWLIRLLAVHTWATPDPDSDTKLQLLLSWIREHYGLLLRSGHEEWSAPDVALPAELDQWLEAQAPKVSRTQVLAAYLLNPSVFYRRRWRHVRELREEHRSPVRPLAEIILFSFPALAIIFLTGFLLVYVPTTHSQLGTNIFIGLEIVVVIAVIAAYIARRKIGDHAYQTRARYPAFSVRGTPIQGVITVNLSAQPSESAEVVLESDGRVVSSGMVKLPETSRPYDELASLVPDDLAAGIGRLRAAAGHTQRVIQLQLQPGLGAPCWEALLANGPAGEQAHVSPLRIVRTVQRRTARPTVSWPSIVNVLSVVSDLHQDDMATQGWREPALAHRCSHRILRDSRIFETDFKADDVQVLHLVAAPVDTAAGHRLELGYRAGAPEFERGFGRLSGRLLKPSDLLDLFPQMAVCVLQATPHEGINRTDADRRQAGLLRLMAEEIFCRGVMAVITIPPLPSPVATELLRTIADAIFSRPRRPIAILADAVRRAVATTESRLGVDAASERVFDLCLYATEGTTEKV
jgi:hypothetical protein